MVCTAASGTTCREVLQLNPNAASGMYLIDPDGFGGNPPFSVYCDMVKDGGGWTNIDFSNNKVLLDNGHFVLCQGGMSTGANSVTCTNPVFDQDQNKPLYHFNCSGTDNSANYIIDHMAIKLGHKNNPSLGFSGLSQAYTNQTSSNDKEYCYINGTVVFCNAYNSPGNGNCRPGYFTISF
jgi:hypothetical protein